MRLLPANCLYTILTAVCDTFRGGVRRLRPPPLKSATDINNQPLSLTSAIHIQVKRKMNTNMLLLDDNIFIKLLESDKNSAYLGCDEPNGARCVGWRQVAKQHAGDGSGGWVWRINRSTKEHVVGVDYEDQTMIAYQRRCQRHLRHPTFKHCNRARQ